MKKEKPLAPVPAIEGFDAFGRRLKQKLILFAASLL